MKLNNKLKIFLTLTLITSFLVGCSSEPPEDKKPTEQQQTINTSDTKEEKNQEEETNTKEENSIGFKISNNNLIYDNKSYQIIDVDGGDRSGHREKNVAVDIGFGDREYWALTNEHSQLVHVFAKDITLQNDDTEPVNSSGRYYHDEANVPGTEHKDLDQGHIIADSLGGVANAYNITPQNSTLNRHGDQAYLEKVIREAGGCSDFKATIYYPNNDTQTPSKYKYEYVLKGSKIVDEFKNESPEKDNNKKPTTNTEKPKETEKPKVEKEEVSTNMVWLSATGEKAHSIPDCGRMNPDTARKVPDSNYEYCSKCW